MSQIEKLKIRLGITDTSQDSLLQLILDEIEQQILAYTNRDKLLPTMENMQIKMAIIEYNKQGSEGMNSTSQGGVSQSWIDGYPKDIQDTLTTFRRLKVSNYATPKL